MCLAVSIPSAPCGDVHESAWSTGASFGNFVHRDLQPRGPRLHTCQPPNPRDYIIKTSAVGLLCVQPHIHTATATESRRAPNPLPSPLSCSCLPPPCARRARWRRCVATGGGRRQSFRRRSARGCWTSSGWRCRSRCLEAGCRTRTPTRAACATSTPGRVRGADAQLGSVLPQSLLIALAFPHAGPRRARTNTSAVFWRSAVWVRAVHWPCCLPLLCMRCFLPGALSP